MGTTVGRLYFYVVTAVSLLVMAFGGGSLLSSLGRLILEPGSPTSGDISYWRTTLSTYIPMLAVGGAVWAIHWYAMRRRMAQFPEEQQAALRKLFLNVILTIASVVALYNTARLLYYVLSAVTGAELPAFEVQSKPFQMYNAAVWLLVYGFVWYYHWQVEEEEGRETAAGRTLRRWYLYITSSISLGALGAGVYFNLSLIISYVLKGFAVQVAGNDPATLLRQWSLTLAPVIGGALWWALHWRYASRSDVGGVLRQVYLYFWILVGVATSVGASGAILYQGLRYLFGYRDVSVNAQLGFLQVALPLLVVGAASWAYHRSAVREEAPQALVAQAGVRRRYGYLVSALGLLALTVGLANLIRVLLEVGFQVGQEIGRTPDWWRDQLSAFISLAVLGAAVWLPHWQGMERVAHEQEAEERGALSRRILLFLILFAAVITILFNGAFVLNSLLRLLLGEPATGRLFSGLFASAGNVAVVGLFLFYHWRVLQRDREAAPAAPRARAKAVTVLAADRFQGRVRQLEEALGKTVTMLRETPGDDGLATPEAPLEGYSPEELQEILSRVERAPGDKVLLLFTPSGVEVHPYS